MNNVTPIKKPLSFGRAMLQLGVILLLLLGFIAGIVAIIKWAGQ